MTQEQRSLERHLINLWRSWSRIHKALIPRTLHQAMFADHEDVVGFVIEEFAERIGVRTLDPRLIPATTGGIQPDFYEQVARIPDPKKDSAYPNVLRQILTTTHTSRTSMLAGMNYELAKDFFLGEIKPCEAYLRDGIEWEMRQGDGSYRRHMAKLYAQHIVPQAIRISMSGKEKLSKIYKTQAMMPEEKQRLLALQDQLSPHEPTQSRQAPQSQTRSGFIIASLDDIKKYSK